MPDVAATTGDHRLPVGAPGANGTSTAQFGVMLFLASDVMLFAPFFGAYFLLREGNQPWPPPGVELDTLRALAATIVLVASSFTLIASDRAAAADRRPAQRRWLLATIGLGAVFLANQLTEYVSLDFGADDHPYGSIYWLLTGLHGAHVTVGIAAMALLFVRSVRARSPGAMASWTHGVSLFWHLVDVIWVFVFSTIWVLR